MSISDSELLELAAKAYDDQKIKLVGGAFCRVVGYSEAMSCDVLCGWNPLQDDGDALRLAVKLKMDIQQDESQVKVWYFSGNADVGFITEDIGNDRLECSRRAIVRAAAKIGRSM